MWNILFILLGLGLSISGYWFPYSTLVCVFAWLGIILPLILRVNIWEILKNVKSYKKEIFFSILINFAIRPLIAFVIGSYLFDLSAFQLKWLILLSILPGGGLLLYWVKKSGWDIREAFLLFLINFVFFSLIYYFSINFWSFGSAQSLYICAFEEVGIDSISCFAPDGKINPIAPLMVLIIVPLFLAFFIEYFFGNSLKGKEKILANISKISTSLVLFYIFGLKDVGVYLKQHFWESLTLFWPVLVLYLVMLWVAKYFSTFFAGNKRISVFWISVTRFIMLGVFFVVPWIWVGWEKVLPLFLWAFVVQILINLLVSHLEYKWKSG